MNVRRGMALCVVLCLMAGGSLAVAAQRAERDEKRRSRQEQQDIEALVKLVDGVSMGEQSPGQIAIEFEESHFVKGQDGKTYIPFTVKVDPAQLSLRQVAMYVRVAPKAAAEPAEAEEANRNRRDDKQRIEYPWDNVHFLEIPKDGRVSRALAVAGGEYEMFIAMKERNTGQRNQPPQKTGVAVVDLSVPDFTANELATSSVIVAETVEPVQTAMTNEQQQENPYTFGTMRIVPADDPAFQKSGELQVVFWIYGATQDASKKPDVQIEYNFHQRTPEGEKYFNKTAPQVLNAQTLPPQFDMALGHQLPGSLVVPLASFPAGDYRLEIKVTDKPTGKTLTRDVLFSVVG